MDQEQNTTFSVDNVNKKNDTKWKISTGVFCAIAICGIAFGIYSVTQSVQKDAQIKELNSQISESNTDVDNNTDAEVPDNDMQFSYENCRNEFDDYYGKTGYINVSEWGIKIDLDQGEGLRILDVEFCNNYENEDKLLVSAVSSENFDNLVLKYAPILGDVIPHVSIIRSKDSTKTKITGEEMPKAYNDGEYNYFIDTIAGYGGTSDLTDSNMILQSYDMLKALLEKTDSYSPIQ